MFRAARSGLMLVGLFLGASQPLGAQDRVTPRQAKGGEKQGEAWAEVPDSFKHMKLPDWLPPRMPRCRTGQLHHEADRNLAIGHRGARARERRRRGGRGA